MSNKTSDKNVANVEEDVKVLKDLMKELKLEKQTALHNNEYGEYITECDVLDLYDMQILALQHILAEREQMLKAINTVEKEKGEWIKAYQEEKDKQFNILINSIPKQKIKDLLTEIQEEYNKLDKEIDKQIKDKNKDYYKCKENIAIMQTLAYCRDKFEGLLEEK